jgi:hypothetical protein
VTNPLRPLIGRLIARTAPKKGRREVNGGRIEYYQLTAVNGLVISYYPPRSRQGPYIIAGCRGRRPTRQETADLLAAIRTCTGVENIVYSEARIVNDPRDDCQTWYLIHLDWKPAETPAPVTERAEAVTVYQVIRWSKDGNPYSGGVSTDRAEAAAMSGRASGRRYVQEIQLYPKPQRICYGMKLKTTI